MAFLNLLLKRSTESCQDCSEIYGSCFECHLVVQRFTQLPWYWRGSQQFLMPLPLLSITTRQEYLWWTETNTVWCIVSITGRRLNRPGTTRNKAWPDCSLFWYYKHSRVSAEILMATKFATMVCRNYYTADFFLSLYFTVHIHYPCFLLIFKM